MRGCRQLQHWRRQLSLGIQGIKEEQRSSTVLGKTVPGTSRVVFLQYNFTGKIGIDGKDVRVSKVGANAYAIKVPKFIFIGYSEPKFEVATEDGGVLSWATPEIDKVAMVNEILNSSAQAGYITSNAAILREQTETFYTTLIKSVDSSATVTFEFAS